MLWVWHSLFSASFLWRRKKQFTLRACNNKESQKFSSSNERGKKMSEDGTKTSLN